MLTARQLSEWEVFLSIEPEKEWRQDFRIAFLSSLIVNIVIRSFGKTGAKLTSVKDFMFDWTGDKKTEEQSVEQMKEILSAFAAQHNKKLEKNGGTNLGKESLRRKKRRL